MHITLVLSGNRTYYPCHSGSLAARSPYLSHNITPDIINYRFVPQNENDLQLMYTAMSQGQALNPDPSQSPDEDEEYYMDGEEFDEGTINH